VLLVAIVMLALMTAGFVAYQIESKRATASHQITGVLLQNLSDDPHQIPGTE
jgi:hypothetical protein